MSQVEEAYFQHRNALDKFITDKEEEKDSIMLEASPERKASEKDVSVLAEEEQKL